MYNLHNLHLFKPSSVVVVVSYLKSKCLKEPIIIWFWIPANKGFTSVRHKVMITWLQQFGTFYWWPLNWHLFCVYYIEGFNWDLGVSKPVWLILPCSTCKWRQKVSNHMKAAWGFLLICITNTVQNPHCDSYTDTHPQTRSDSSGVDLFCVLSQNNVFYISTWKKMKQKH